MFFSQRMSWHYLSFITLQVIKDIGQGPTWSPYDTMVFFKKYRWNRCETVQRHGVQFCFLHRKYPPAEDHVFALKTTCMLHDGWEMMRSVLQGSSRVYFHGPWDRLQVPGVVIIRHIDTSSIQETHAFGVESKPWYQSSGSSRMIPQSSKHIL